MCDGISRLEYCLERAERSPSPLPLPPLAGSNVGRAAVVISLSVVVAVAGYLYCTIYYTVASYYETLRFRYDVRLHIARARASDRARKICKCVRDMRMHV